jgi:hypothetical protein
LIELHFLQTGFLLQAREIFHLQIWEQLSIMLSLSWKLALIIIGN